MMVLIGKKGNGESVEGTVTLWTFPSFCATLFDKRVKII